MRREVVLLAEMICAAERIIEFVGDRSEIDFEVDRDGRDALLWNYTVLGEAAAQLPKEFIEHHEGVPWRSAVSAAQPDRARLLVDRLVRPGPQGDGSAT